MDVPMTVIKVLQSIHLIGLTKKYKIDEKLS
jgi:hypothetical protein